MRRAGACDWDAEAVEHEANHGREEHSLGDLGQISQSSGGRLQRSSQLSDLRGSPRSLLRGHTLAVRFHPLRSATPHPRQNPVASLMMVQSHEGVAERQYRQQQRQREVDLPEHGKPGGVSPANVRHGDDAPAEAIDVRSSFVSLTSSRCPLGSWSTSSSTTTLRRPGHGVGSGGMDTVAHRGGA
jgi:hypothetical protein